MSDTSARASRFAFAFGSLARKGLIGGRAVVGVPGAPADGVAEGAAGAATGGGGAGGGTTGAAARGVAGRGGGAGAAAAGGGGGAAGTVADAVGGVNGR